VAEIGEKDEIDGIRSGIKTAAWLFERPMDERVFRV
jgi:hypothetical protein